MIKLTTDANSLNSSILPGNMLIYFKWLLNDRDYHLKVEGHYNKDGKTQKVEKKFNQDHLKAYFGSWNHLIYWLIEFTTVLEHDVPIRDTKSLLANKETREALTNLLGTSPKTMHRIFRGIVGDLVLDPIRTYLNPICLIRDIKTKQWRIDFNRVYRVYKVKDLLDEIKADNLLHLWPIVYQSARGPEELKKIVGKACWKEIANNTLHRNKLLFSVWRLSTVNERNIDEIKLALNFLVKWPSTLLANKRLAVRTLHDYLQFASKPERLIENRDIQSTAWYKKFVPIIKESKMILKNIGQDHIHMFRDTNTMALALGRNPSPKTWDQVRNLHYRYAEEQLEIEVERKAHKEQDMKEIITIELEPFEIQEYKITPLVSKYDLYKEGKFMHHCIYSYHERVKEFKYYVVHIENTKTEEHSTLGLTLSKTEETITYYEEKGERHLITNNTEMALFRRKAVDSCVNWREILQQEKALVLKVNKNQHYGKCNKQPETTKQIEQQVIDLLNKKLNESKKSQEILQYIHSLKPEYNAVIDELDDLELL